MLAQECRICLFTKIQADHHHQSLNRKGLWGTTNDFATSFLYFSLFSTALWDLLNSRPVHSLMLSSHLFLCLPCLLPPFTVPCKMVLARPDERETWPYHCSLRLFTIVRQVPTAYLPIHQRCIKCWLNILRMQEDRTPLKSYKMFLTCTVITKAIGPPLFALCCIDMVLDTFQCLKREIFVLI